MKNGYLMSCIAKLRGYDLGAWAVGVVPLAHTPHPTPTGPSFAYTTLATIVIFQALRDIVHDLGAAPQVQPESLAPSTLLSRLDAVHSCTLRPAWKGDHAEC